MPEAPAHGRGHRRARALSRLERVRRPDESIRGRRRRPRAALMRILAIVIGLCAVAQLDARELLLEGDLSYINEMEDCGARYSYQGERRDPYEIFRAAGANVVRLRLWHTPTWTKYSNLADVKRSIKRAKAAGMQVMLAFHYSDTWADPQK